jgi:hypothetical protein
VISTPWTPKAFGKVLKLLLQFGRITVCNKWIYSAKPDGTLTSRAVTHDFSQLQRNEFTYSYAPVIAYLACRVALNIIIQKKLHTGQLVLEIAFLCSDLEKKIKLRITESNARYMLDILIHVATHMYYSEGSYLWYSTNSATMVKEG